MEAGTGRARQASSHAGAKLGRSRATPVPRLAHRSLDILTDRSRARPRGARAGFLCAPRCRCPHSVRLSRGGQLMQRAGCGGVDALMPIVPADPVPRRGIAANHLFDQPGSARTLSRPCLLLDLVTNLQCHLLTSQLRRRTIGPMIRSPAPSAIGSSRGHRSRITTHWSPAAAALRQHRPVSDAPPASRRAQLFAPGLDT